MSWDVQKGKRMSSLGARVTPSPGSRTAAASVPGNSTQPSRTERDWSCFVASESGERRATDSGWLSLQGQEGWFGCPDFLAGVFSLPWVDWCRWQQPRACELELWPLASAARAARADRCASVQQQSQGPASVAS